MWLELLGKSTYTTNLRGAHLLFACKIHLRSPQHVVANASGLGSPEVLNTAEKKLIPIPWRGEALSNRSPGEKDKSLAWLSRLWATGMITCVGPVGVESTTWELSVSCGSSGRDHVWACLAGYACIIGCAKGNFAKGVWSYLVLSFRWGSSSGITSLPRSQHIFPMVALIEERGV